tara:strand:- start:87 stop:503 length:417 start_codon:yes stop_codon:yes gene_type:complete
MKNNNWKKRTVDGFNSQKKQQKKDFKKKQSAVSGSSVTVWNNDVNGALKKLKKVLERADRQKEIAKREFYEKPSAKRKRRKDQAKKRTRKSEDQMIIKGEWMPQFSTSDGKSMKGKRQRRKAFMQKERIRRLSGRRVK